MNARFNIRFVSGPRADETFSMGAGEEIVLGSAAESTVIISGDAQVLRRHARLWMERGVVYLEDYSGGNGLLVNGKPIRAKVRVNSGDRVQLGQLSAFHAGWWNALELSRFASVAQLSHVATEAILRRTGVYRRARRAPWIIGLLLILVLSALGGWAWLRPGTFAKFGLFEGTAATTKAISSLLGEKSVRTQVASVASIPTQVMAEAPRNFVWDEIVNVSRRFGDAPPSAMDTEFLAQVEKWIDAYTRDDAHKALLERRERYWQTIEAALKAHGLPSELGYLVWVESRFDPLAKSGAGARGLWQFMPVTARSFGLRVDKLIDERTDPLKASKAAAQYITMLLKMFGSDRYLLAIASYNAGQNKIHRKQIASTIRRARKSDFWHLKDELPKETVNYVPRVLAAMIIARNPERW
jgi:soluble lytic murein transglycosylase-like protein